MGWSACHVMKTLVAVDGSACTGRLLEWLRDHGWFVDGHRLTMLHVVPAMPHRAAREMMPDVLEEFYDAEARPVWNLVRGFLESNHAKAQFRREIGDAAACIARIAVEEHFELIAMGTHGPCPLTRLILGSVTAKVLATCPTPMLLVPRDVPPSLPQELEIRDVARHAFG
jgi:nucleotide-binding universal stress UspA family protein